MPRYEDQPTVQVHCHQEAGKLSLLSDRLWKIPRNLIGSQRVEEVNRFTILLTGQL